MEFDDCRLGNMVWDMMISGYAHNAGWIFNTMPKEVVISTKDYDLHR